MPIHQLTHPSWAASVARAAGAAGAAGASGVSATWRSNRSPFRSSQGLTNQLGCAGTRIKCGFTRGFYIYIYIYVDYMWIIYSLYIYIYGLQFTNQRCKWLKKNTKTYIMRDDHPITGETTRGKRLMRWGKRPGQTIDREMLKSHGFQVGKKKNGNDLYIYIYCLYGIV